ncbi:DUF1559 family PulG-like putative transporter [Limnoglobus roseus]|uniref:DUF1559 domain-containing protein n=1 Tax=Limnoglobus roseus TaxID=2598579 RepID=A0A5C1ANI6_9BACT|nr:DUF1559 domain-containing protein [Limnoglobus roseus]QEL19683.1 hypothetical protein PX52LOC_06762 [Limnoglobus roseus]
MRYLVLLSLALIGTSSGLKAADPPKLPKELAIVPNDALAAFSLDVATLGEHPAFRGMRESLAKSAVNSEMARVLGLKFEDVARFTTVLLSPNDPESKRFEPEVILLVTARKPLDKGRIVKSLRLYGSDEVKELEAKHKPGEKRPEPRGKADAPYYFGIGETVIAFADDRTVVFWKTEGRRQNFTSLPNPLTLLKSGAETGPLTEGIVLAATHPCAGAANMVAIKRARQNDPFPDDLLPLFRADKFFGHATLGKDAAEFTVQAEFAGKQWAAEGEEAAKKLRDLATLMMKEDVARSIKRSGPTTTEAQLQLFLLDVIEKVAIKPVDNSVVLTGRFDLGSKTQAMLTALPGATTESALQTKSMNNLKQLTLAYHNYSDATSFGVSNVVDKDGKSLLSWRVHLLPYLEQQQLYSQFKLDEPWDSENNKKLIEKMPAVYAMPGVKTKDAGMTFYQGFVGKKDQITRPLFLEGENRGIKFPVAITDGTVNTIFCVEAQNPVVWTKPEDLPFDPDGKLPKLGQHLKPDCFQAALLDGSVRSLSTKLPEATLKAYITINGGEVIDEN